MANATSFSQSLHCPDSSAHHQIQINIIRPQTLQTALNALAHNMMPRIVQLGCQPYIFSRNTRIFDPLPNFVLVSISKRGINVTVSLLESNLDRVTHFVGLALPRAKTDSWDLVAGIEGESFPR